MEKLLRLWAFSTIGVMVRRPMNSSPRFLQAPGADPAIERAATIAGLLANPAFAAPKHFYDSLGSHLFDAITELPEYYPTRTEASIFAAFAPEMARLAGTGGTLVDLGAGNGSKAARLFPLFEPRRYVAVDISVDYLRGALRRLQREHPGIETVGIGMDFSASLDLPPGVVDGRPLFFYPGSSIGNFAPGEALAFLRRVRARAGGGGLLIGVDLVKPRAVLEAAYDDALGVTAAFNRNLLRNLNRTIGSDFDPAAWQHVAFFDASQSRIEMHLEAGKDQLVRWPGGERRFEAGERLHTENSYKYEPDAFAALLHDAGFEPRAHWTDPQGWFAVFWASA